MLYLSSGMLKKAWTCQKPKNKYTKDAEAKEDDYNASVYEKITSYVENPLKDKENPIIYLYNTHQPYHFLYKNHLMAYKLLHHLQF